MTTPTTTPARFLFTTWEGGGNIPPVLTVVAQLTRRGHAVRVMGDDVNRDATEAVGAEFIPWTRAPNRSDRSRASDLFRDWETTSPQDGVQRMFDGLMFGPALAYAQDVLAELSRVPADLVVSSEMLFGVMAACESAGQKLALLTANLSLFPLPGVPPFGPGLPIAQTEADRALHAQIAAGNVALFDLGRPADGFLAKAWIVLAAILVPICFAAVPGYPIVQILALKKLRGRARLVSAAPLAFMVPV